MKNQDFTIQFTVDQTPSSVLEAINNVRGWWSENIKGDTDQLHSIFDYHYQDVHEATFQIMELSEQKVRWHVLKNRFKFLEDQHEWQDSDIIFDIQAKNGGTLITFTHKELTPAYSCYDLCKDAWTHYIQGSLKQLITTGTGEPTPKEDATIQKEPEPVSSSTNIDIHHRLRIDAPIETVYKALTTVTGLKGWWTPSVISEREDPQTGDFIQFSFGSKQENEIRIQVATLHHYDLVKWNVIDAHPGWADTSIRFELEANIKGTMLNFSHTHWKEMSDEFASCNYVWALFLKSLKQLCETGKGRPFPDFDK
ncbi:Uncharacterized conserved protein YndB, AHSA1/START domain [Arachidicoccus rhizosphaerae]|uniref:Uncharacterized conserved protein YndB, AHSA1/START domain n=1 Tax=Arachidicoccus rhizosphaerae TaxID=551991 RepID=A0A1H3X429_9BACT|nr:SRPBCC family protein [Arachidicoccus rhizosphaerae]SDZ93372.1 Uncharacterized conserved protein YndB, AHSA1/START domain [Arachidicoccus rhizosphaerae]